MAQFVEASPLNLCAQWQIKALFQEILNEQFCVQNAK